ncbi:MAG TPA: hypothetical protein VM076_14600, partial [Gemmatimonadaceae bacterium]|nr:hypothetical protein [Gemmatimonadaceae bacterium]
MSESSHDVRVPTPAGVPTNGRDTVLNRSLRYEVAGEEGRALIGSYGFAFALGIAWLLFVYFGPRTLPMQLLSPDERPIAVSFDPLESLPDATAGEEGGEVGVPTPGPTESDAGKDRGNGRARDAGARPTTNASAGAIADAFGGRSGTGSGGLVGDVSN